jgi:uncharacterized membrane protein
MSISESFLLLIRWLHNVSAMAWVGGSLLHIIVLRPVLRAHPSSSPIAQAFAIQFRSVIDVCILILFVTGSIMLFDRLTPGNLGMAYIVVVTIKIAAALWLFLMAYGLRRHPRNRPPVESTFDVSQLHITNIGFFTRMKNGVSGASGTAFIGVGILLLADVLRWLVEQNLQT